METAEEGLGEAGAAAPFLLLAECSLTLFPQSSTPKKSQSRCRGQRCGAAPQSWGFITPAPGSPQGLRRAGEQRSRVPDGILINNNTQLLLRWDKPCCKSLPFPRLSVAFEDLLLLLLLFISFQAKIRAHIQTCYNAACIPVPREQRAHPARLKMVSLACFVRRSARLVPGALLLSCHSIDLASHSQPHYLYLISTRPFWGLCRFPHTPCHAELQRQLLEDRKELLAGEGSKGSQMPPWAGVHCTHTPHPVAPGV